MTYQEFSTHLASYGFLANPMTESEYAEVQAVNAAFPGQDIAYGIACDMNAGLPFWEALVCNTPE